MHPNHDFYQNFSEEQFAADEFFQQWVLSPDRGKERFWDDFLQSHPGQKRSVFSARRQVRELAQTGYFKRPLSVAEKQAMKEELFRYLELNSLPIPSISPSKVIPVPGKKPLQWAVAAAAIAVIACSVWLLAGSRKTKTGILALVRNEETLIERTNAKEIKRITLTDSSVVILNPNSSLRYSSNFAVNSERTVSLDGNAYFIVKKDPANRPFLVTTRSLTVSVLGTQFNVDARSSAAEVALTSGKVKVNMKANERKESFLLPGEKLVLDTLQQSLVKSAVDPRLYMAWTQGRWEFLQTSLKDIAVLIHQYYGINVVFQNEKIAQLRMTALLQVSGLRALEEVISKTLLVKVTETNNQLLIH